MNICPAREVVGGPFLLVELLCWSENEELPSTSAAHEFGVFALNFLSSYELSSFFAHLRLAFGVPKAVCILPAIGPFVVMVLISLF